MRLLGIWLVALGALVALLDQLDPSHPATLLGAVLVVAGVGMIIASRAGSPQR